MARPLRLEFAGALYHVTPRGNRREAIYETDTDRESFLSVFADAIVFAYASGGYSLKEVGEYFNLHYSTVSGIIKGHKSKT